MVEICMRPLSFDTEFYVLKIRRMAAGFQSGECLNEIKESVDALIKIVEVQLRREPKSEVEGWAQLLCRLHGISRNTADPDWMTVIAYARRRINTKKHTAITRRKKSCL